jgi:hypothetical protein
MRHRGRAPLAILALGAAVACSSHPEKSVVDSYFNAVNAGDNQTISSFAVVNFDKKVQRWNIKKTVEEAKTPLTLPDLAAKVRDLEKAIADNTKAARAYNDGHFKELTDVKALAKGAPVPAKLQPVAAEWEAFNKKDRELKKALAEAKDALEKEKRMVSLSLGSAPDDVENLSGEVVNKKVLIGLTIDGQEHDYVMTLRKYNVKGAGGRSRWMIQGLSPA